MDMDWRLTAGTLKTPEVNLESMGVEKEEMEDRLLEI